MRIFSDEVRRAYEAMPVPLAYYRQNGDRIEAVLVSDGLCRMMGHERDQLIRLLNDSLFERVHPDDAGRLARIVREFAQGLCGYDVIYRSKYDPDGEYHYIHSIGKVQRLEDGTVLALFTYTDVSESESESRMLLENYQLFQKDRFYNDSVTGLPNVNFLREFADEKLSLLHHEGRSPVLLYFDVNGLRSYNNQYGVGKGDELLKLIADVLKNEFPDSMVVRGVDDHFVVVTEFPGKTELSEKIDTVNDKIRGGAEGNISGVKAGICVVEPEYNVNMAMDYAKHAHKNIGSDLNRTHIYYTHETDDRYWNQRYILEAFGEALESEWIKIYYQAIMRVRTGKAAALEALARWVDPVRGIIMPGEFIPVLEKYHLLYKLDLYMVEQFCREVPLRRKIDLPIIPVSINFSAQDFDHADIVGSLNEIFERYGEDKNNIIIEITEQDLAMAAGHFKEQLKGLKENGYRVWVDDFGSGYSSLNIFSQYNVDVMKFDMEFLRHLDENNGANRYILKAMVSVGKDLGIRTLAEGVETAEQLEFLREIGCDFAQGYYYYKPESFASISFKLRNGNKPVDCETPDERRDFRPKKS